MSTTFGKAKGRRTMGIRDAKARLSELLHDVQNGHEWVITERGKPIARVVPISDQAVTLEERLRRLEASGILEAPRNQSVLLPRPLTLEFGSARDMLDEDRAE